MATPVFSTRRVPELVVDAAGAQQLQPALDHTLAGQLGTCYVVAEGSQPIAARNADTPLIPASTEKLLTATAALSVLGPSFRYRTNAVAAATPQGGVVDRLWVVGAGDPVLTTDDFNAYIQAQPTTQGDVNTRLEALADSIVAAGVHRIPGGIVGDDSRYDQQRYVPSWPSSYRTDLEIGPLGALTVNSGDRLVGGRPQPVDDPALATAAALTTLLAARGVQVGPPSAHQPAPAGAATVGTVASPTLHDILVSSIRSSDNLAGELLAKEVGVRTGGQGTTAAGVYGIMATLAKLGVPTAGLNLVDGSGLDRGNRTTCRTLAAAVDLASTPAFHTVAEGFAVAGSPGTLITLGGSPLAGKLRGKTGSLNGVSGLAGLLDAGRPLHFSLLVNGDLPTLAAAQDVRDRFASALATFPAAPGPDALVPAPDAPRR